MAIKAALQRNSLVYNGGMGFIFLSPHFDDVALSCGGLVWALGVSRNPVSIWTLCGGETPAGELSPFAQTLHVRWELGENAPSRRRLEDQLSCERLGASQRIFSLPDCIYRRDPKTREFMYASEAALNGELHTGDYKIIPALRDEMMNFLEADDVLICPLGVGNHVDHQLTRKAAEELGHKLLYYADFPYVLEHMAELSRMEGNGWVSHHFTIFPEGLAAWIDSIAAYASQISTFWSSIEEMAQVVSGYWKREGGIRIWEKA